MCFIIHRKYPEEKIAKKDIVCYKILERYLTGGFLSPYQKKHYNLNKIYRSEIILSSYYTIDIGLHSYSCKKHSIHLLNKTHHEVLTKGIIPKGSKYYYNPHHHEYVSNQIIIQEVIK